MSERFETELEKRQKKWGDCYECLKDKKAHPDDRFLLTAMIMIVCLECGNKRCPKGTDHRLACTNSNESNQVGSRYHKDWQSTQENK